MTVLLWLYGFVMLGIAGVMILNVYNAIVGMGTAAKTVVEELQAIRKLLMERNDHIPL